MTRIIRPKFGRSVYSPKRGRRSSRRRSRSQQGLPTWIGWCAAGVLLLLMLYLNATPQPSGVTRQAEGPATHIEVVYGDTVEVVDGDTVRINSQLYRLTGFNTPESGLNAACEEERLLAAEATDRLRELVDWGGISLRRVACACAPDTEGTRQCNYGRLCAKLTANGRDVGSILIAEGLAERYECRSTSCPRRRDWCWS